MSTSKYTAVGNQSRANGYKEKGHIMKATGGNNAKLKLETTWSVIYSQL